MTPKLFLTTAAFSALLAGSAFAQDATNSTTPMTEPAPASDPMTTPSATDTATPASGVVRQSSPTPVEQAYTLKAGDASVTSNGPVADTAENRAKYGGPMSRAGKRTSPAGN